MKMNTIENGKVVIREMTEEELAAVPKYEAAEPTASGTTLKLYGR